MGKSQQSFNKKEREKKRQKKRKEKAERKLQRKEDAANGKSTEQFMYVDENGNLTPTPPDPNKKSEINADDIRVSTPKKEELDLIDTTRKGKVKFFNSEKGFGFIIDKSNQENIFFHAANLVDEVDANDDVSFEVEMGKKGLQAVLVKLINK